MQKLLLSALVLAGATSAQTISMPPFQNTFTSTLTRGFWFQAPVAFTITGIQVYNESNQPNQVVEVIDLLGAPPPAYPSTVVGTQLAYSNSVPAGQQVPMAIVVTPGQYIGILAACNPSLGSATSANSYSVTPGPYTQSVLGVPITLTRFGTQSGIAANGGNQPCWQEAAFNIARADVYVSTASGFATKISFGQGCYDTDTASFYELFATAPIDLAAGTSLNASNTGNGYVVIPGTSAVVPPTSAPIAMGDDVVIPFALGWSLPYPGGTTTDLYVSSNGFVTFTPNTNNGCCSGSNTGLLTGGPRWAALWNDLNPGAGGTVHFDTDAVNGTATITFTAVPRYATQNLNTFQYRFDSLGNVELRYGACAAQTGTTLIGWSPGLNNVDPGPIDISATPVILTAQSFALELDGDARPVIGTTVNLTIDNIPAGSPLGALIFGLTKYDPGIDLTGIGMAGCFQYCSQDSVRLLIAPGTSSTTPFAVPNNPALAGVEVKTQGAAYNPGVIPNALGANSSNGVQLNININ